VFWEKKNFSFGLVPKLILVMGFILLVTFSVWGYLTLKNFEQKDMDDVVKAADQLCNTILLSTYYAMMINSRNDIKQIITNIARQKGIENIRLYNKKGEIKYTNYEQELDQTINIKSDACNMCHKTTPPFTEVDLIKRIRIFQSPFGHRLLGIISPIYNEPGCATDNCHAHPKDQKILGTLDLVVSLKSADSEMFNYHKQLVTLGFYSFIIACGFIAIFLMRIINRPIKTLIKGTQEIRKGNYATHIDVNKSDEMGLVADAINKMIKDILEQQYELNKQRDEYRTLFETVPCIITIQDRNYKLIGYNREFGTKFNPQPGDHCYQVYKGRQKKCVICPVEKTFADGNSHYSEETGRDKDGSTKHWIVRTAPIRNSEGEIVAAMEMNLDITERKQLEKRLEQSEKKYHLIFNNIPNPVFVLDFTTLNILDCNNSVTSVYGYYPTEIIETSFLDLYNDPSNPDHVKQLRECHPYTQVHHLTKRKSTIVVNVRVSPSEYTGSNVLLVTIDDVTKRVEAELQLIQASKMATLGEMATGIAHELNQPLSVIKTASSFFMRKIGNKEPIKEQILLTMAEEIDSHVDRATRIINHMRQFGRKSDLGLDKIQVNNILEQAYEIFCQQLKVRGINVKWETQEDLPMILAEADRLEQVFINLMLNARDAIEERWENPMDPEAVRQITLSTKSEGSHVIVSVADTGHGIPKDIRSKIFEPFFTTKKVGKGTGLGLSISYGIIKECGGKITATNNPDGGAFFQIRFPIPGND
jgi:histidine kinase